MKKTGIVRIRLLILLSILFWGANGWENLLEKQMAQAKDAGPAAPEKDLKKARAGKRKGSAEKLYSIQTDSFRSRDTAADKVARLKSFGHDAFYRCVMLTGKGKFYRVFVGKYAAKEEAEEKAGMLVKQNLVSGYIVRGIHAAARKALCDNEQDRKVYFLHLGSYKQKSNAEAEVQKLKKNGYESMYTPEDVSGERWFKVYLGEFENEKTAGDTGEALKKKGLISYYKTLLHDQIVRSLPETDSTAIPESRKTPSTEKTDLSASKMEKATVEPVRSEAENKEFPEESKSPLIIDDIKFVAEKGKKEIVTVHADRFFSPTMLFLSEKENPRVVIHIQRPALFEKEKPIGDVKGAWIKKIEVLPAEGKNALTVVLHLKAFNVYKVGQAFDKQKNVYAVEVVAEK